MHPSSIVNHGVLLVADIHRSGYEARQVQREAANRNLLRVRRGVYVDPERWKIATERERQVIRLRAVALTRSQPSVFSHHSAAALHKLPVLGAWSKVAHISSKTPARSKNGVLYHQALPHREPVFINGLLCTSLIDTLVDLARTTSFTSATISIDHALHSAALAALPRGRRTVADSPDATRSARDLVSQIKEAFPQSVPRGHHRGLIPIDFATHLSDSPGESLSRCGVHLLGFPPPELQHPFSDYRGFIGRGDFWWEHIRLLGEFDGEDKYKNPEFLNGRTPEQAVIDEKWREDRIRSTNVGVSRWDWKTALDLPRLYAKLFAAGLRTVSHR